MVFSNKLYDQLKFVAQIALPALGTLYAVVSGLWKWPNTEEVVGTIIGIDAFLGALLSLSAAKYERSEAAYDGEVLVNNVDGTPQVRFNMTTDPVDFGDQRQLRYRVINEPPR